MTAVSVVGGVPVTFMSIVSVRCRGTASVRLMYFYSIFSIYSIKQIKSTVSAYHNRVSVRNVSEQMTEPVWFVMDIMSSISGVQHQMSHGENSEFWHRYCFSLPGHMEFDSDMTQTTLI